MAENLNIIQFQKSTRFHRGINREPYLALFGRQPVFGLKAFNLPEEIVDNLETEDELWKY